MASRANKSLRITSKLKVAIVYDHLNTRFGGAERLLLSLHQVFPKSVLFTAVFDASEAKWVGDWEVRTSFLQRLPLFWRRRHQWLSLLMPFAFESLKLSDFDVIISVTSEFAKAVITHPHQLHICLCLTPTRYLWSHTKEYVQGLLHPLKEIVFSHLRVLDYALAQRPDAYIAISNLVQKRIRKYYRRESVVIYPPCSISILHDSSPKSAPSKRYYLVVSRLVAYKKIDLAIQACMNMKRHLQIVGKGEDADRLRSLAGDSPYIHFLGAVDEQKLSLLYSRARALLCPQEEDFGMVGIESQTYGVPVLSFSRSGVAETIVDGKTGLLFTKQNVESLVNAMRRFEQTTWNEAKVARRARMFQANRFESSLQQELYRQWRKHYAE